MLNAVVLWKYHEASNFLAELRGTVPSVQRQIELLEPTFLGEKLNSFSFMSMDGYTISSDVFFRKKGHTLIAAFNGETCDRCLSVVIPRLGTLFEAVGSRLNILVSVSPEQAALIPQFKRAFPVKYCVAIDDSARIARSLKLSAPVLLLLDSNGRVICCHIVDNMKEERTSLFLGRIEKLFTEVEHSTSSF